MPSAISDDVDFEWDEILNTPPVPHKANASLSRHMESLSKWFKSQGLNSTLTRKNEVVLVTIPAAQLFAPNATTILPDKRDIFNAFEKAIANPESYRLLVAVYTDDTGDEKYADEITEARADAIHEVLTDLIEKSGKEPNLYISSFGSEHPVVPNNSIDNRAKNRRVEIYLVPEKRTIDAAAGGRF